MSFWAKIGVTIKDLQAFESACKKHGIRMEMTTAKSSRGGTIATLHDTKGNSKAYLHGNADGSCYMKVDNDPRYSTITQRLGKNGGKLMRDYTQGIVEKNISRSGGIIAQRQEQPDGSIVLKVAVGM